MAYASKKQFIGQQQDAMLIKKYANLLKAQQKKKK